MAVTINETSWPQLQRLRFIERQLLWDREVTLSMLTGAFGILRPEALDSIKTYIELAGKCSPVRAVRPQLQAYRKLQTQAHTRLCRFSIYHRALGGAV